MLQLHFEAAQRREEIQIEAAQKRDEKLQLKNEKLQLQMQH